MNIEFIKSNEKNEIIEKLNEQFGISELPYLLIWTGKEKIRAFSGSLSKDEIMELGKIARIELIGAYLIKDEGLYRLSFDAPLMLKEQISKNIADINDEQLAQWIRGNNLELVAPQGVVVIKHNNDFIGCGKSNGNTIFNYIPKDRRLKK
jgi:NOL1/NOP2/fmu family ribosome biogenesis protein